MMYVTRHRRATSDSVAHTQLIQKIRLLSVATMHVAVAWHDKCMHCMSHCISVAMCICIYLLHLDRCRTSIIVVVVVNVAQII